MEGLSRLRDGMRWRVYDSYNWVLFWEHYLGVGGEFGLILSSLVCTMGLSPPFSSIDRVVGWIT